jgi:hypothetical protein
MNLYFKQFNLVTHIDNLHVYQSILKEVGNILVRRRKEPLCGDTFNSLTH